VSRRGFLSEVIENDQALASSYKKLDDNAYALSTIGQTFAQSTLRLKTCVKKHSLQVFILGLVAAAVMSYLTHISESSQNYLSFNSELQDVFFGSLINAFNYSGYPLMFVVNLIVLSAAILFAAKKKDQPFITVTSLLSTIVLLTFVMLTMQVSAWYIIIVFFLLPFIFTFLSLQHLDRFDLVQSVNKSVKYVSKNYFNFLGLQFLFFLILALIFIPFPLLLFPSYKELIQPFLFTSTTSADIFKSMCMYSIFFFSIILYVIASMYACSLQFQQSTEIINANSLKEKIKAL